MDYKLIDVEISSSIFLSILRQYVEKKNYEVRSCGGVPGSYIQSTRGVGTLIAMSCCVLTSLHCTFHRHILHLVDKRICRCKTLEVVRWCVFR